MKKIILALFALFIFVKCSDKKNDPVEEQRLKDSIITAKLKEYSGVTDDMLKTDSAYRADCPVKILSARPVEKEYSNYKDVSLSYRNISSKDISAIRFKWYGINAFNEPADMGLPDGYGSGFTDETLKKGKSSSGTWNVLSKDLKKVINAWVTEVAFTDGTKWQRN